MAYLPMAWIGDHMFSFGQSVVAGFTTNCPESAATVLADLKEIGPTYFFAPPRIWENILTSVMIRVDDTAWVKRRMVHFFLGLARRVERRRLAHRAPALLDRLLYPLGWLLVYGPLRDNLGMGRIRVAYTAGEAIGPELFEFYRSLGINVKQLYGMTESSALICIQQDGDVKLDTVGPPLPGVEVRISETGEVLYRGPGVFQGYYRNPEATRETLENGWVHSGDAGFFDKDGHLKIIDRARDVGRLSDGHDLRAQVPREQAQVLARTSRRRSAWATSAAFVGALINIDLASVGNWAERRGLAYTSYTDLAQKPEVYELIRAGSGAGQPEPPRRGDAARAPRSGASCSCTRSWTRTTRRSPAPARCGGASWPRSTRALIEALYGAADHVNVEALVTYEDGRTGTVRAAVRISEAEIFSSAGAGAAG